MSECEWKKNGNTEKNGEGGKKREKLKRQREGFIVRERERERKYRRESERMK